MFEHVYMILSSIETLLVIILIARYIFLEPKIRKCGIYACAFMMVITAIAYVIWGEDIGTLFVVLSAGLALFMARHKHRIRGFFLVIPVLGIAFGIIIPLDYLLQALFPVKEIVNYIVDLITVIILILFWWFGKSWRIRFEQEEQFRIFAKWERYLLVGTGWLIIFLSTIVWELEEVEVLNNSETYTIFVINLTLFVLTITIISFVLRGNKSAYYEGIAKINEHYLGLELQHFEAYKITQQEVRRMQHDMKHHMACLQHLCKQGDIEEIQNYLNDISEELKSGDMEINCGHILAGSICTHKANIAAQKGIRLEVDGRIPEQIELMPVDLCTILSNALDNAIEAVENMEEELRFIRLEMSSQGKLLFFRFSNPVKKDADIAKLGVSTKKDIKNHGFGLLNIKYVVEKYNGQMLLEIEEKEVPEFVLSIIVGKETTGDED